MEMEKTKIDIVTLFPKMFEGPFAESIIKRGIDNNLLEIGIHDLRPFGIGAHQMVDDRPYGGGVGMVFMVEPMFNAINSLKTKDSFVIATSASGDKFTQKIARDLSLKKHLIIIAGHYEGYDQRILDNIVDQEISIGDYILTGGELPSMVIAEAVARLIPGVLKKEEAAELESFSDSMQLEHPHYTRPEEFNGWSVPEILRSGNHAQINSWREEKSKEKTKKVRPDLA
jgi:tRNA (guanine37-N1)-methyltransferase